MKIRFLGAGQEVGRSAILINDDLLLDYGIKPTTPPTFPIGALNPKTILISHGHLDHCGVIPNLMDLDAEIYSTAMTKNLTSLLAKDTLRIAEELHHNIPFDLSEVKQFEVSAKTKQYGEEFYSNGYKICFYNAGHIPGSSMIHIARDNETLTYTGDFNLKDTLLQQGASTIMPPAQTLITESTYFGRNHVNRSDTESRFINSIKTTMKMGGHVIISAFAIGRTQEILMLLKRNNISAYVDGMGVDVGKLIHKDIKSIHNHGLFNRAFDNIVKPYHREELMESPQVIVTTAGMLNGGPVLYYLEHIANDPRSKLMLTGYQVDGTNGRMSINQCRIRKEGRIINLSCQIEQYNFSAHVDDLQLKNFVEQYDHIFCIHGDRADKFAEWCHGIAPKNTETFL